MALRILRELRTLSVLAWLAAGFACSDPISPGLPLYPDIRNLVVAEAAAALDAEGRLMISNALGETAESVPLVNANHASQLAAAFAQSFGPAFQPWWTRGRGAAVSAAELAVNSRILPIQSPFGRVPDIGCHPSIVRLFGSYYLMTLGASAPEVHMSVSAQTSEYSTAEDGDLVQPSRTGNDFFHAGIPITGTWVVTPEQAVAVAAGTTGALVAEVPRLTRRNVAYSPSVALWRIALDRDVIVRRQDGVTNETRVLYVGNLPSERFYVPRSVQPTQVSYSCPLVDENLVSHGTASFAVPVLAGHPVDFDLVSIVR